MYPPLLRQRVKTICIFQLGGEKSKEKMEDEKRERKKSIVCSHPAGEPRLQTVSVQEASFYQSPHPFPLLLLLLFIGIPHIPENVDKIRLSRGCPGGVWQLSKGKGKLLSLEPASEVPVIHHSLIFSPFIRIICSFILLSINYCVVGANNYAINDRHLRLRSEIIKS